MRDQLTYFPVNWIDGMKINKSLFIAQDDAVKAALHDVASLHVSPIKYGVLPSSSAGEDTFVARLSIDNQNTLRASVLSCQAVTCGGVRINLPVAGQNETDGIAASSFTFVPSSADTIYWIALIIHPFNRKPFGALDMAEMPPRFPFVAPAYEIAIVDESQYNQFTENPYALMIGKVLVSGNSIRVDDDYIPPCYSVNAHPDLIALHGELDHFFSELEIKCLRIVQKIFIKNQQNEISQLVMFLCDRVMLFVSNAITDLRWNIMYESPSALIATIVGLSRIIKNAIDFRIGSGKDELMRYFSEWCDLKQGEMEIMLSNIANIRYNNNDINKNIQEITAFVRITSRLFENLVNQDLLGTKKESGYFRYEEKQPIQQPSRSFFKR